MTGKEGSTRREKMTFSLMPCTANHIAVEEGVTGDEGPRKGCPSKRKAAGSVHAAAAGIPKPWECEAYGMFSAQEMALPIGNTLKGMGALEKQAASGGNGKLLELGLVEPMAADLFSEEEMSKVDREKKREKAKALLSSFPEAKALNQEELQEAIDRIMKESHPETSSVAAAGMVRLPDQSIKTLLVLFRNMIPSVNDLLDGLPGKSFPPGWIHERMRELDNQCQQANKKMGDDFGVFLAKIRVDLITKGYVEFQEEYMESRADLSAQVKEQDRLLQEKIDQRDWSVPSDEED